MPRRLFPISALFLVIAFLLVPLGAMAQGAERLYAALGLDEVLDIMRAEGIEYGGELQEELFPGRANERWRALVANIYDPQAMADTLRSTLDAQLAGTDVEPIVAFFESDRGQRIIGLELGARRALLDEDIEEASRAAVERMRAENAPILDRLTAFIDANDLIDSNVVGALNSNVAFYRGLSEGGAFSTSMTEQEMLRDVWAQEPDIREETETWLYSFLGLAYEPLAPEDLDAYIAFSRTSAGGVLNRALFAAFDGMFTDISFALGRGAAQFIGGQEL